MMAKREKPDPMPFTFIGGGDASALPSTSGLQNNDHWNQVLPPVMPWSTRTCASLPNVVRFTGDGNSCPPMPCGLFAPNDRMRFDAVEIKPKLLPKRKCPIEPEVLPPKIHVTDEQMASRMKFLHISNESPQHMVQDLEMLQEDVDVGGCDGSLPSLVVCDEIRQLQVPNSILPPELVARLERPSKALVLWKPPEQRAVEMQRIAAQSKRGEAIAEEGGSCDTARCRNESPFNPFNPTPIQNSSLGFNPPAPSDVEEMSLDL